MNKKRFLNYVATAVVSVGITVAVYLSSNDSAQDAAGYAATHPTARPTATVTKTLPAPDPKPAPTVTVTTAAAATVSVPQACLDALDNADTGFGYASTALEAAGNGFAAVSEGDVDKLLEQNRIMKAAGAKTSELAPTYNANKAACRAAGVR
jgi:hypothetical protein